MGNHDVLWIGAYAGSKVCLANLLRICARYDNLDIIEDAYGINLRPYLRLLKSITMLKTQRLNLRNDQIKTSVLQSAKKVKSQNSSGNCDDSI